LGRCAVKSPASTLGRGVLVLSVLANLMVLFNVPQQFQGLIEGAVIVASIALYYEDRA
jgi:ribose/xylose/arabinose/galactoside ABC-type transport system permease subunit